MNIKKVVKRLIPHFLLDIYYYAWALTAAVFFGFPSRNLTIIGVTGTSGKSTTVDFMTRILEEAGNKVVSNSSVRFKIGDKEQVNNFKMSMPGRFFMQKLLRQGVEAQCRYAVLEVTSEGIKQFRHVFINFHTAVFTNLSPEHIESHGGFENYRNAKLKLFEATKNIHIINIDDENAGYFVGIPSVKNYLFGVKSQNAVIKAENIASNSEGINFEVERVKFHVSVLGDFNVYNALAAISVAISQEISLEICKKALEKVSGIPGRMEVVSKNPLVVVDYAHTAEQLEQAYQSLNSKPLICVLGSCGGGRDKWRRPVLGKIAEQYCSQIIITNEDPYDEDPLEIMEQVAAGIDSQKKSYHIVLDRKEAIKNALKMAKPDETVIITGKGSEVWMCVANGKKIPWSDKQIVKDELKIV